MTIGPALALVALIGIRGWAAWDEVVTDYDVPPRLLETARTSAQGVGPGGIVEVELAIGKDGRVDTVTPVRSVPSLDETVVRAVCAWRFTPARRKGVPVRAFARAPAILHPDFGPVGGVVGSGPGPIGSDQEPIACPR